jgi:hypothetical protein
LCPQDIHTRTSSQSLVHPNPEPKRYLRRRVNKNKLLNTSNLDLIVEDLRFLFEDLHIMATPTPPWVKNVYKALDISRIQGSPHDMPEKYNKWLPKFVGNNVITVKDHLARFYDVVGEAKVPQDHEDVVMKLFSLSLEEDVKVWFRGLNDGSIKSWKTSMMPS